MKKKNPENKTAEVQETTTLSLATMPTVTPELGSTLLSAAIEKERRRISDGVIEQVRQLMKLRDTAREWEKRNADVANQIEKQLRAIEAGAFNLADNGKIIYHEKELNEPFGHEIVLTEGNWR